MPVNCWGTTGKPTGGRTRAARDVVRAPRAIETCNAQRRGATVTHRRTSMAEVKEVGEVYRCDICGNVVEVKEAGGGELVCCGEPMKLVE